MRSATTKSWTKLGIKKPDIFGRNWIFSAGTFPWRRYAGTETLNKWDGKEIWEHSQRFDLLVKPVSHLPKFRLPYRHREKLVRQPQPKGLPGLRQQCEDKEDPRINRIFTKYGRR